MWVSMCLKKLCRLDSLQPMSFYLMEPMYTCPKNAFLCPKTPDSPSSVAHLTILHDDHGPCFYVCVCPNVSFPRSVHHCRPYQAQQAGTLHIQSCRGRMSPYRYTRPNRLGYKQESQGCRRRRFVRPCRLYRGLLVPRRLGRSCKGRIGWVHCRRGCR